MQNVHAYVRYAKIGINTPCRCVYISIYIYIHMYTHTAYPFIFTEAHSCVCTCNIQTHIHIYICMYLLYISIYLHVTNMMLICVVTWQSRSTSSLIPGARLLPNDASATELPADGLDFTESEASNPRQSCLTLGGSPQHCCPPGRPSKTVRHLSC